MKNRYSFWQKGHLFLRQILPWKGKFGQIFFTNKCNIRCGYCKVTERETKDISIELWEEIVKRMSGWGITYISITGGESTIRKDLERLIRYLRRLHIFTRLNSNGMLLTQERIDSLAKAGLCSLAISLDAIGDGKSIKNDSERILGLLEYAKTKGILAEARAVLKLSDPRKIEELVQEVTDRGLFFGFGVVQAVGGLFSKPSRFGPIVGGMAKNKQGIWLPSHIFQEEPYVSASWKCDPEIDSWITVNNDGTLMCCQEWGSDIPVLKIKNLKDPRWRNHKREAVGHCPGCYYDCYYSQQEARSHIFATLQEEFKPLRRAWEMFH